MRYVAFSNAANTRIVFRLKRPSGPPVSHYRPHFEHDIDLLKTRTYISDLHDSRHIASHSLSGHHYLNSSL